MNSKMNISKLLGALIIILALTFSTSSYAITGLDDGGGSASTSESKSHSGDSKSDGGGDAVPLDGGLSVLLLGGAAFGIKKLRDSKK